MVSLPLTVAKGNGILVLLSEQAVGQQMVKGMMLAWRHIVLLVMMHWTVVAEGLVSLLPAAKGNGILVLLSEQAVGQQRVKGMVLAWRHIVLLLRVVMVHWTVVAEGLVSLLPAAKGSGILMPPSAEVVGQKRVKGMVQAGYRTAPVEDVGGHQREVKMLVEYHIVLPSGVVVHWNQHEGWVMSAAKGGGILVLPVQTVGQQMGKEMMLVEYH